MVNQLQPDLPAEDARFAIVVSRYNQTITQCLLDGAVSTLCQRGVREGQVDVAWVPGAWEIPLMAELFIQRGGYDAVLCLGAVIKGETAHDTYINQQVSANLGAMALRHHLPILFGILTCQTIEQAKNRAGGRVGNKGIECAEAALEMAGLVRAVGKLGTIAVPRRD